jgi:hypothetical protein
VGLAHHPARTAPGGRRVNTAHALGGRSFSAARTNRADGETQLSRNSAQSLCILGVGVDTRRVPVPKSASTATVPQTETIRPRPWRSWQTRSPTEKTSSGGIASRAALKGLAGRRRRCTGGGMYPSSSLNVTSADPRAVCGHPSATRLRPDTVVSRPEVPRSRHQKHRGEDRHQRWW